jgi:Fusaric acid resistance protein-like
VVEAEKEFVNNITRLDRSSFSLVTGIRAGAFVVVPLLFGPAIGIVGAAFAALGGMWLTNTEGSKSPTPAWVLLVACLTESAAVGLGTVSGTAGAITPVLVGIGVFLPMLVHGNPRWTRVGTFTAITFAVGVGLPGGLAAATQRAFFSFLGTLWVLLGIEMHRYLANRKSHGRDEGRNQKERPNPGHSELHPDALRNAVTIGAASAIGFWIGMTLGLPRDFWVVITIILAVQPSFNSTLAFTSSMLLGTIIGAVLGAAVIIGSSDTYIQLLFLSVFAVLMFATRGVNVALVQVFLAPFIILLLYQIYLGHANFAEARVVDVLIGGLVSVATVYVLGLGAIRKYWKRPA